MTVVTTLVVGYGEEEVHERQLRHFTLGCRKKKII